MGDDYVAGGILPVDDETSSDGDFDPNAVESGDEFLDDGEDVLDDTTDELSDDDDDLFDDE